jgi:hypothetical protein
MGFGGSARQNAAVPGLALHSDRGINDSKTQKKVQHGIQNLDTTDCDHRVRSRGPPGSANRAGPGAEKIFGAGGAAISREIWQGGKSEVHETD